MIKQTHRELLKEQFLSVRGLYGLGSVIILIIALLIYNTLDTPNNQNTAPININLQSDDPIDETIILVQSSEVHRDFLNREDVVLLDVRTLDEWATDGHIEGSISIPLDELASRAENELNMQANIVVICGDETCGMQAARLLAQQGFEHIHSLKGGVLAWVLEGLPLCKHC